MLRTTENGTLHSDDLMALADGSIMALRVKKFFPVSHCEEVAKRMLESPLFGYYANKGAENIGRVGQAFYECQTSAEARETYVRKAVPWMRQLREGLAPMLTPIDKLRLELDETWPNGAGIGRLDGIKLFAGLGRVFEKGSYAEPHQDVLSWDIKDSPDAEAVTIQLAANVYLSTADAGGALVIWPASLTREQYEKYRNPGSYGVQETYLPAEPLVIEPEVGDLILFNARNVHAVRRIDDGRRVTWSCFIGLRGIDSQMLLWS